MSIGCHVTILCAYVQITNGVPSEAIVQNILRVLCKIKLNAAVLCENCHESDTQFGIRRRRRKKTFLLIVDLLVQYFCNPFLHHLARR